MQRQSVEPAQRYFRDLKNWKRNAIREVLAEHEDGTTRYAISDEQLEQWDVQVDGRAQAFIGVGETIVDGEIADDFDAPNQRFLAYVENPSGRGVDELALEFAKDLKTSPLWGPGVRLAERDELEYYVEALLEDDPRVRGADDIYLIVSESGSEYLVDVRERTCECGDATYRGVTCKHQHRVRFAAGMRPIPVGVDRDDVDKQLGEHVSGEIRWP